MINFNENAIREAAYYIWKNNGCPANTSAQDWNAAIEQLSALAAVKTTAKRTSCKSAASSLAKLSAGAASLKAKTASALKGKASSTLKKASSKKSK